MTDADGPQDKLKRLARWATTPPQAYGVYLAAMVLVFLASFYAGTMKPKPTLPANPPVAAPRG